MSHFWYSEKQKAVRTGTHRLFATINGKVKEYTCMSDDEDHGSAWDDMHYLGEGEFLGTGSQYSKADNWSERTNMTTSIGNCKNCKRWDKRGSVCRRAEWVDKNSKLKNDDIYFYAGARDDSGLYAGVMTGPMFGCIKFEERAK